MKEDHAGPGQGTAGADDALAVTRENPANRLEYRDGTRHFVLRPLLRTDAEEITEAILASVAELRGFMPWVHGEISVQGQLARLEETEAAYWASRDLVMVLCDAESGAHRSYVGLHARIALNPAALEVGYWTPTPHAGQGLCTLAARLAILYAFEWLGSDRVQVMHDEVNEASRRVVEKCGFRHEGILRNATAAVDAAIVAGGYLASRRTRIYALLPEDRAELDWYAPLLARVTAYDQVDRPSPPASMIR